MSNIGFIASKDKTVDFNAIRNDGINSTLSGWVNQDVTTTGTPTFAAIKTTIASQAVSDPPTDAELDAIYTSPATVGSGWTKLLMNSNSSTLYFVVSDGTNWHAVAFAVCV